MRGIEQASSHDSFSKTLCTLPTLLHPLIFLFMNNKDFIQALSRASNTSAKDTTRLVDSFLQLMADKLDDQNVLNIPNVGSFEVKKKTERIVVSPVTKKRKLVPPKLVLTFRAASNLKDKLKTNSAD